MKKVLIVMAIVAAALVVSSVAGQTVLAGSYIMHH